MNKKIIRGLVVFLFLASVWANSVFADFDAIYMTDSSGSFISQTIFDWGDTPWLYLKLPESGLNVTQSNWKDPDSNYYFIGSDPGTEQEIWLSLNDWDSIKRTGLWEAEAVYSYASGSFSSGSTSFTVSPEPISSILFVTGGATLAVRHYRKKKKKV